jgi:hypothetical protein
MVGVLIWYWINRNIGLSSIGLNEIYLHVLTNRVHPTFNLENLFLLLFQMMKKLKNLKYHMGILNVNETAVKNFKFPPEQCFVHKNIAKPDRFIQFIFVYFDIISNSNYMYISTI